MFSTLTIFAFLIIIDIKPDAWRKKYTHIHNLQANKKQPTSFKAPSSFVKWLILDNVSLTNIKGRTHYKLHKHVIHYISYLGKYSGSEIFHNCYSLQLLLPFVNSLIFISYITCRWIFEEQKESGAHTHKTLL